MTLTILLFGIATDLIGRSSIQITVDSGTSVAQLKLALQDKYSRLKSMTSYAIAVNEDYANDALILNNNDVVAIIPPVSGG